VLGLWGARESHSFTVSPTTRDLVDAIANVRLVVTFVAAAVIARAFYPAFAWLPAGLGAKRNRLALLWFLFPVVALYAVSVFTDAKLFVSRYYIWGVPGIALLVAALLASIEPPKIRRTVALALVLVSCMRRLPVGSASHGHEDWRGGIRESQLAMGTGSAALLLHVGFTESRLGPSTTPATIEDPLVSPLAAYPFSGDVFLLPSVMDDETPQRLERLVVERLLTRERIVLLARQSSPSSELWWRGRLGAAGYSVERIRDFDGLTMLVWRRPGS
jgi:hypothetical protein